MQSDKRSDIERVRRVSFIVLTASYGVVAGALWIDQIDLMALVEEPLSNRLTIRIGALDAHTQLT